MPSKKSVVNMAIYRGLNPEQAELKFLNTCKDLRRYGQHLFAVYVSVDISIFCIMSMYVNRIMKEV